MEPYRALPDNLKDLADATQRYFSKELGLNSIKVENEIDRNIDFRPTISATSVDKHIICGEIVEELFSISIQRFVLDCRNQALPVKLYVAVRKGLFQAYDQRALRFAKENGVAILEINPPDHGTVITNSPVSLSLSGLRNFALTDFPSKYREPLKIAIDTFRAGNPAKGCSDVYDELEQLTRRLGKKAQTVAGGLKSSPQFNWENEAWARMLEWLRVNVDKSALNCPNLSNQLISRLIGLTAHRNETGHKPSSLAKRVERDKQLRTRFETAVDELRAWIDACRPLKI